MSSSSVFKVYPSSPPKSSSIHEEENPVLGAEGTSSGNETGCSAAAGVSNSAEAEAVDEHLKIDSNLVIVVGKDGSVHVDQKTLHSLLGECWICYCVVSCLICLLFLKGNRKTLSGRFVEKFLVKSD